MSRGVASVFRNLTSPTTSPLHAPRCRGLSTATRRGHRPVTVLIDGAGVSYASWNRWHRRRHDGGHMSPPFSPTDGPAAHFATTLHTLMTTLRSDHMVFCLDDTSAHRKRLHPAYKVRRGVTARRMKPWQRWPQQRRMMRTALAELGVPVMFVRGHEADDVIATYTQQALRDDHLVRVVSRDKDLLQLVQGADVLVYDWIAQVFRGPQHVLKTYQVPPHLLPDVLALGGDKTDNIPGLRGMGLFSAARLVRQFGGLEAVLARIEEVVPRARRELIRLHAPRLQQYLQLTTLRRDVPLPRTLQQLPTPAAVPELAAVLRTISKVQ